MHPILSTQIWINFGFVFPPSTGLSAFQWNAIGIPLK